MKIKKLKSLIGKIVIGFCMAFAIILGCLSNNVLAEGVTWNPNDKGSNVVLTNNNLTASGIGWQSVRSTVSKNSGKWYCEFTPINGVYNHFGIANSDFQTTQEMGFNTTGYGEGYESDNGWVYAALPKTITKGAANFTANDTIGITLDLDNNLISYYKNNVLQNNHSISHDTYYIAASFYDKSTSTVNFGATPFKYTPPEGFLAYDNSNILPVSMTLNKSTYNLQVGQTDTLTATITPNNTTSKTVIWKSSDNSIVTVDSSGKVSAIKEGTTTITASTQDGSNISASCAVNVTSQTSPVTQGVVLNVEPEKSKIKLNETVSTSLTIDNIKDIAAEDIRIKYDSTKLQFLSMDEVDGIKLVKSDTQPGELRAIVASKGAANVVNVKKTLLKLNFKGIAAGDALVNVTKGRVSDGIEMEKDLTDEQCGQATITIEDSVLTDVNNSGEFTLLDLAIDGRHYSEDPTTLIQYNTDIVVNKAIDNDDLTKIGEYMLANPNYKF